MHYDANGNNTSIAYPDGSTISYIYDKNNRMTKVEDSDKQVTQYTYDAIGNILQIQQPGNTTSYTYNENSLPVQILYQLDDGTQMEDNLAYDVLGNIINSVKKGSSPELTEHGAYSYDALGQLISYSKGLITETDTYDILGNMLEKSINGNKEIIYQYNELNQLTNKIENGITYSYQYDKRGNLIEEMRSGKLIKQYTYDETNRMVLGLNTENGEKTEYIYNGLHMRVKNIQTLGQLSSSYQNYAGFTEGENQGNVFKVRETNYVIDYLSETNNELLSYETDYGETRVIYGRGSERLSQKVTIYSETPKTIRTDIAEEKNGISYFQSDILGSVLFASNKDGEVIRYAGRKCMGKSSDTSTG